MSKQWDRATALVRQYVYEQTKDWRAPKVRATDGKFAPRLMLERLKSLAQWDLMFGPFDRFDRSTYGEARGYPGYVAACDAIEDAISGLPSELFVDLDCDAVMDREPEGWTDDETGEWVEPELENVFRVNTRDAILGILK